MAINSLRRILLGIMYVCPPTPTPFLLVPCSRPVVGSNVHYMPMCRGLEEWIEGKFRGQGEFDTVHFVQEENVVF